LLRDGSVYGERSRRTGKKENLGYWRWLNGGSTNSSTFGKEAGIDHDGSREGRGLDAALVRLEIPSQPINFQRCVPGNFRTERISKQWELPGGFKNRVVIACRFCAALQKVDAFVVEIVVSLAGSANDLIEILPGAHHRNGRQRCCSESKCHNDPASI
jgi:hypothetical protein